MKLPEKVKIFEVGPRDGFQKVEKFIPTAVKIEIIDQLSGTGLTKIEATSFVHPRVIPQTRDAEEVLAGIQRRPGVIYSALVPNVKGAERALSAGADEINAVVSVSETYNRKNVNMSVAESLQNIAAVIALAREYGRKTVVSLANSFGCPFEGEIPEERVLEVARQVLDLGAGGLVVADTTGLAGPLQVRRLVGRIEEIWPGLDLTLHFHDTRGLGLANVYAALEEGADQFDCSIAGLGGSPAAPYASGNVCTEDVAFLLKRLEIESGLDLPVLLEISRKVEEVVGFTVPGRLVKAGLR
ncbi:MAG: hydroxymethylglutaryl-CoA lyase [Firmicutes bacterium]|nr:hydroxymethylglutaryl-CoA lyase [Bacillota bacterium]MCL5040721.1 hydroxymethylglutaryl-CoA lyase [Bacillota bacterium]